MQTPGDTMTWNHRERKSFPLENSDLDYFKDNVLAWRSCNFMNSNTIKERVTYVPRAIIFSPKILFSQFQPMPVLCPWSPIIFSSFPKSTLSGEAIHKFSHLFVYHYCAVIYSSTKNSQKSIFRKDCYWPWNFRDIPLPPVRS